MKVKDPVCKMEIEDSEAAGKTEYKGETYFFCSEHCKEKFSKEPEKYLAAQNTDSAG